MQNETKCRVRVNFTIEPIKTINVTCAISNEFLIFSWAQIIALSTERIGKLNCRKLRLHWTANLKNTLSKCQILLHYIRTWQAIRAREPLGENPNCPLQIIVNADSFAAMLNADLVHYVYSVKQVEMATRSTTWCGNPGQKRDYDKNFQWKHPLSRLLHIQELRFRVFKFDSWREHTQLVFMSKRGRGEVVRRNLVKCPRIRQWIYPRVHYCHRQQVMLFSDTYMLLYVYVSMSAESLWRVSQAGYLQIMHVRQWGVVCLYVSQNIII